MGTESLPPTEQLEKIIASLEKLKDAWRGKTPPPEISQRFVKLKSIRARLRRQIAKNEVPA